MMPLDRDPIAGIVGSQESDLLVAQAQVDVTGPKRPGMSAWTKRLHLGRTWIVCKPGLWDQEASGYSRHDRVCHQRVIDHVL